MNGFIKWTVLFRIEYPFGLIRYAASVFYASRFFNLQLCL
uniref:Uncharacterized protein n=1 Tax=Rhizophora mucronata TaxID=61149 RepID=A0A2P2P1N2_RHIMU